MKKIILILVILITVFSVYAQEETDEEIAADFAFYTSQYMDEISKAVNEFFGIEDGMIEVENKIWASGRSSALIEKGHPKNTYEIDKISDSDVSTAWVEGVKGSGIGEYVLSLGYIDYSPTENTEKKLRVKLKLNNGFCKNKQLFKKNNRVKELKIVLYAVPIGAHQYFLHVNGKPVILYEGKINLSDTMAEQVFPFDLVLKGDYADPRIVAKCTIQDVYKGTDYDDTCISELQISAEWIE